MRDAGLVRRWSRRDWLSAAVVATTAAFLVGTALLLTSAGAYTSTLEGGLATSATVEYTESPATIGSEGDRIVVPVSTATVDGTDTRVVGIPADAPAEIPGASVAWKAARLPQPTANAAVGPVTYRHEVVIEGTTGTVTRVVRPPESRSVFPARWYADRPSTTEEIGTTGAFVIDPGNGDGASSYRTGVPLIGTIPFILLGIRDVLRILSLSGVAGGVVVLVVVYSVTRMSVRDRRTTVRVLRATGADPLRVGGLIAARATAVTAVGVGAGVLAGVAAPPALVAAAGAFGVPVTLPTDLTTEKLRVVASLAATLTLSGVAAGVAAAVPSVRVPPVAVGEAGSGRPRRTPGESGGVTTAGSGSPSTVERVSRALRPRLLGVRAAVPTAATLSVFVLIVLVVGGLVGTLAPLAGTGTGTITESGAAHPLNSRIDADYARVLRAQGVAASPEIIAAQVTDGRPYLVRGANYTAFAAVSGATLVEGRPPAGPGEAVVGDGLARTLGVDVGDSITLGGSVSPAIDRVRIVGRYEAPGLVDDQLVVPLATVGDSATGGRDQVHLIRTEASAADALADDDGPQLVVTRVVTPSTATAGEPTAVTVTVRNFGNEAGSRTVAVETDGRTITRSVDLAGGEATVVRVNVTWADPGTYPIAVGPFERSVRVTRPGALTLPAEFPRRAPPDSTLLVPVVTTNGTRLSEGRVRFGEFVAPTNAEGVATVPVPSEPGTYPVVVSAPGYGAFRTTVEVTPNATRDLSARIRIDPESGTPVTRPNVSVVVANPWGATLERNLTLVLPTGVEERTVRLRPGNTSRVRVEPEAAGFDGEVDPGTYTFRLLSDGDLVATERYRVVGGEAAVAGGGLPPGAAAYASGTGIGTVITRVFGNVQVLFAGMVLLAGVATVSGTVAAFARAVQSRGRTVGIYRATGMSRRRVVAIVAGDALRLAVPAVAAAFALAAVAAVVAERLDLLVAFGVRIELALLSPAVGVALVGSVGLAVASAAVASVPFLLASPALLLRDGD